MVKFKKMVMGIAAAAVMSVSALSGVVSANYDSRYDINKDGYVSSSDAVMMNKFLCGAWAPSDVSTIDVNQNGIVDWIDGDMITAYILGTSKTVTTH
ncbi:dockerin type I repeat-containing protein [Porcipelethomonas sp.]|uniref:dockerin type I repeat-containing protein n=1 Tax=Porcipelethomonas sp. TaxID=2981675 RepID=UPI003EF9EC94